ncbi:kinase-like domain-containing protein [Rhizophagus clarus]|uniref:Kinase-like domain-containing protein n=1 Tax=Rhizophagus clarus TaxID=94130 RepID=A0A8H3L978_9GLOM|nr:kinase-like domain-containing protein [Rhizophagus clarus]
MSTIRRELIYAALNRAFTSMDYSNIHDDLHKGYEVMQQKILADNSLTEDEKTEAIRLSNKSYDRDKIRLNSGIRRISNFSNWTSENNAIDDLIKNCQMETLTPSKIIEWIPYNKFQNVKYLTRGGFSKIYTAAWIDGKYGEWNTKKQQLIRYGEQTVVLKELINVKNADQSWFEEAKSHLTISNKYSAIIQCFGLTKNQLNGNYMLVIKKMDTNLREYLQQNNNQLIWKERIKITFLIIDALYWIHKENSFHRDLHSGNILYSQLNDAWLISDFGFCGPANRPSTSIYGNLSYIAPEVINGYEYTFKSDIYSIAMLMWEISSGQPPFINYEQDTILALGIIDGMRPKIISEIPLKYKNLMEQCWDADPLKRPDIELLKSEMNIINLYYQNNPNELPQLKTKINEETNCKSNSKLFTSKIYEFKNLLELKNATEEKQKGKRKFDNNLDENNNKDKNLKKLKLYENKNEGYLTKELMLDIDNNNYISKELDFDIDI